MENNNKFGLFLSQLHSLAGPVVMLMYPLFASIRAMESSTKIDDEQWLAYWILYSLLSLMEMLLEPVLTWIPIWYDVKLVMVAWLVLPQFKGAAFIYERLVRQNLKHYGGVGKFFKDHPSHNKKNKFVDFMTPNTNKQGDHHNHEHH